MLFEPEKPRGFHYIKDFITRAEEVEIIAHAEQLSMHPYVMRGQASRRRIARFGYDYGNVGGTVDPPPPLPNWLLSLRNHAAGKFEVSPEDFVSALVTCYPPGATIGWHRDLPMFGAVVLGISLGAECVFRLRPKSEPRQVIAWPLAPRSAYALTGAVRTEWEHSIPPVALTRYSVTFRSLARKRSRKPAAAAF